MIEDRDGFFPIQVIQEEVTERASRMRFSHGLPGGRSQAQLSTFRPKSKKTVINMNGESRTRTFRQGRMKIGFWGSLLGISPENGQM